jgi:hypothetical protein
MGLRATLARLARDEDGTGSVLPLLMLTLLLGVAGFGIDTANLWRTGEIMRATADAAAHAGAVALARGNDPVDALVRAEQAIGLNMDPAVFAPDPGTPRSDLVRLWHFDATSGTLSEDGPLNAVSVQLRRGPGDGNAVPTYLMGLIGLPQVTSTTTAVVALTPSSRCANGSGLFARQDLVLDGEVTLDAGFCLHSQQSATLNHQVKFEPGAHLSLPDLSRCNGLCDDIASPGFLQAATEANLVTQPLRERIADTMEAMLAPMADSALKADFFATRPLAQDLEPLAEMGVDISNLRTGSVVHLSNFDFEVLRAVPQGLVYAISCDPDSPEGPPVLEVGGGVSAPIIDNLALLTDCALHFPDDLQVTGSLVLSSYEGGLPAITADPYAVLGDPSVTCDPAAQTQVMALGDQVLPPGLILSNAAFVLDGQVTLLPGEDGATAPHRGFALHASGTVTLQGPHSFAACDGTNLSTLPGLAVIRMVMPAVPAMPEAPKINDADLPGKKVTPLPATPPRHPDGILSQADLPGSSVGL